MVKRFKCQPTFRLFCTVQMYVQIKIEDYPYLNHTISMVYLLIGRCTGVAFVQNIQSHWVRIWWQIHLFKSQSLQILQLNFLSFLRSRFGVPSQNLIILSKKTSENPFFQISVNLLKFNFHKFHKEKKIIHRIFFFNLIGPLESRPTGRTDRRLKFYGT